MARHLALIDDAVVETIAGRSEPILVIEAPPRHGKSELICRYVPAWYLGTFPDRRVILAMHSESVSRTYGRKSRDLMEAYGTEYFGQRVRDDSSAANDWSIAEREGGMVTAGVGTGIPGRGANLLIIDDPIRGAEAAMSETQREAQWDWFQSTALTRLEPGGCVIVIQTRWHEADLTGRILENGIEGMPVRRVRLPAISEGGADPLGRAPGEALWPERWGVEALKKRENTLTPAWWNALYQQKPGRHEGAMFPDEYFGPHLWVDELPKNSAGHFLGEVSAIAVDSSLGKDTGDPSAIVFAGFTRGQIYVWADIQRRPPTEIAENVVDASYRLHPTFVGIETNGFQALMLGEVQRICSEKQGANLGVTEIINTEDKRIRILRLAPHLAKKAVKFVRCEGCEELVKQIRAFPDRTAHDDGPDALEMAIRLMERATAIDTVPEQELFNL